MMGFIPDPLKPYLDIAAGLFLVAIVGGVFFYGEHRQKGVDDAQYNKERLANSQAVNKELEEQRTRAENYARQLAAASVAEAALHDQLLAIASSPLPHVVCYATGKGGSSGVPGVPKGSGGAATGPDTPDNLRGPGFDPSVNERKLHKAFAERYAECLSALDRWPK